MSLLHRVVLPALTVVGLGFLIACSSSNNSTPPPSGGFTNSDFNGTYTFSTSGGDTNGVLSIAGTITACGCSNGQVSAGTVDVTDTAQPGPQIAINTAGSGYKVNANGTGTLTLALPSSSGGSVQFQFAFVLTSPSHGLISEYDENGTGSGTIDLQPNPVTLSNSSYAFSLSGSDTSSNPLATVGGFTLNSSGGITAGLADFNYSGSPFAALSLSGAISSGTGTAPGTATLTSSFGGSQTFDVYAIDATHLKLIENDGKAVLVGDLFSQPTSTIPSGSLSFTVASFLTSSSTPTLLAAGGTVASDGSANLTSGAEDVNVNGTIDNNTTSPYAFSGVFVSNPGGNSNGRFQVDLTGFQGGTNFAAYPSSGGVLILEIDSGLGAMITSGVAMAQSSPTGVVASQGYAMNLTGADLVNETELDQIAQFNTSGSKLSGSIYYNDFGVANPNNYSISNSSNFTSGATGEVVLNFNGGSEGALYYGVDGVTSLALGVDSSDVSLGMFQQQGSTSSSADVAQRHLAVIKAAMKAHAAKKKKLQ